jgi:hypothetical protein
MTTQVVNPISGPTSQFGPLSQSPASIAVIPVNTLGPGWLNIQIDGVGNVGGYTAPAIAVVQHFDPFANAVVRDSFVIGGGTNSNVISVAVGDLLAVRPYMDEVQSP